MVNHFCSIFKIFHMQILVRLNFGELTTIHQYFTPPIFCHIWYGHKTTYNTHKQGTETYTMHMYTKPQTFTYMHTFTHNYTHNACIYTHNACIYTHTHNAYIYTHIHTHTHTYTYVNTIVQSQTQTHTHKISQTHTQTHYRQNQL